MKRAPRFCHKIYAWLMGYFWLPCPLCGEMFGGHESGGYLRTLHNRGVLVCYKCRERVGKLTQLDG